MGGVATSGGILIPRLGHTFLLFVGEVCLLLGNTHRLRAGPSITLGLGGQKTYHVTPTMPSDSVNECVTVGCRQCAPWSRNAWQRKILRRDEKIIS